MRKMQIPKSGSELRDFRIIQKLTQQEVAEILGVASSNISRWEKKNTPLEKGHQRLLADKFYSQNDNSPLANENLEIPSVEIISESGQTIKLTGRPIPFYDVDVMAGNVAVFTNGLTVPTAYIFAPAFEGCIAIPLKGRSMINAYFPGDILFIEEISHWRDWLEWGEVYVVVTPEQNLVKRVDPSSKKQHWRMVSFNPDNAPFDLPVRYVMQVFQVRGKIEQRSYVAAERIVAREVINEILNGK